jgi:hypothetical protein
MSSADDSLAGKESWMKELVFNVRHTMYWIDAQTGQVKEYPSRMFSLLYGQTFKGEKTYQGKFSHSAQLIKRPLLFVKTADFRKLEIFQKAKIPPGKERVAKMFELMIEATVDCFVIALFQSSELTKIPPTEK